MRHFTAIAMYVMHTVVAGKTDPTIGAQAAVSSASQVSPPLANSAVKVESLTNAQITFRATATSLR